MADPKLQYTESERREAVREYLLRGSYVAVEEALGVPRQTVAGWKHDQREWWEKTVAQLIVEIEGDYRPGWVRVLGKAVEAMEDRLDHGDTKVTKEGAIKVPVSAKEAAVIAGIAADKLKQFGIGTPAKGETAEERQERLRRLAQEDRAARGSVQ
jgi:hypothetical protein